MKTIKRTKDMPKGAKWLAVSEKYTVAICDEKSKPYYFKNNLVTKNGNWLSIVKNSPHLPKIKYGFIYKIVDKLTRKELKKEISQLNSVITGLNSVLVKKSKEIEAYKAGYNRLTKINEQLTNALNSIDGENEV